MRADRSSQPIGRETISYKSRILYSPMPVSHTCPSCCFELGSVRAAPDPHYGLGVVVCPRCTYAVVRTRHPDRVFWQSVRKTRNSLVRLFLTIVFTALSLSATIGMGFWLMPEITSKAGKYISPDLSTPQFPAMVTIVHVMVLMSGCVARVIYGHLRFFRVVGVYLALMLVFWNIDWLVSGLLEIINQVFQAQGDIDVPSKNEMIRRFLMMLIIVPIFIVGMGIGSFFNRLIDMGTNKRIVRIRRRLRKRRSRLE